MLMQAILGRLEVVLGSIHIVGLLLGLYHAHVGGGLEVVLGSIPGSWNKGTLQ